MHQTQIEIDDKLFQQNDIKWLLTMCLQNSIDMRRF